MVHDLDEGKNVYLETVGRLEPDIAMIDAGAFYASAAVSLKRMADAAERQAVAAEELLRHVQNYPIITKDAYSR